MAAIAFVVALVIGLATGYYVYPVVVPTTEEALQNALDSANARISDLQGDVSDLQGDVSDLQAQLAAVPKLEGDIPIGLLLSLSGSLATFGENEFEAVKLAASEANEWLTDSGYDFQILLIPEDTATDPDIALEKLEVLAAQGVKVVLGPLSSSEVTNIKGFADANDILIVSQSSTAITLAIEGDNVFRFTTDDRIQAPVAALLAEQAGLTHVVPVWRRDTYGDGLSAAAREAMEGRGITVLEGIGYDPAVAETVGFGAEPAALAETVQSLVDDFGVDNVGVYFVAFETDALDMLQKASEFPILTQVTWIGSDGTAVSGSLLTDPVASEFADVTTFTNPIAGATKSTEWTRVTEILEGILGRTLDPYSHNMYDMLWVVVHSILAAGEYDTAKIKGVLPQVADDYFGASGWTRLNAAGDRAISDYDLFEIRLVNGERDWVLVGVYNAATEGITWFEEPE
ncbi:MAG: ABC transporter substrate-binding protein [Candidatus Geothermarchaeales archaeon]